MTSANSVLSGRNIIGTLVSVLLAVVFMFFALKGINWEAFSRTMNNVSVFWMIAFAVSVISSHWLRAYRWKVMLHDVKPELSTHHAFAALMIGYGVNNVVPRLGEISRAVFLGQYEGISRMAMLGSIVLERILDVFLFGLCVLIAGIIYDGDIYHEFPWLRATFIIGSVIFTFTIATLVFLARKRMLLERIIARFSNDAMKGIAGGVTKLVDKLMVGFASVSNGTVIWKTAVISLLIMLNYAFSSWIAFFMFGMFNAAFVMAWVTMSISAIGVMIPTPGGIGSYHTITKAILAGLYQLSVSAAIAYALVSHAISYTLAVLLAIVYFFLFRKRYGTPRDMHLFTNDEATSSEQ